MVCLHCKQLIFRRKWSNPEILFNDCGLRLEFLEQRKVDLAFNILKETLSPVGYGKVRDAMRTNHFLGELVNAKPILNELSYKYPPHPNFQIKLVFASLENQTYRYHGVGVFTDIIYV
jgi:hypothetical protein